jgi:ribosomal protein S18 acetylase RimI-like enzyme
VSGSRADSVEVRGARPGQDEAIVSTLMAEYLAWALDELEAEYGVVDMPVDPTRAAGSLDAYRPPHGLIAVAELDGQIAGIGAVHGLGPGIAEIKRMYVSPSYRGLGIASGILDFLLVHARGELRATTVRLDTCRFMAPAQRLYRSRGFVERSPYEGTEIPDRLQKYWLFFERSLTPERDQELIDRFRRLPSAVPIATTVAVVGAVPTVPLGPEGAAGDGDGD